MKKYRKEALHIQLPPESSMERLRINVTAKNNDAKIPIPISFN